MGLHSGTGDRMESAGRSNECERPSCDSLIGRSNECERP
jgi:hypothetical protein